MNIRVLREAGGVGDVLRILPAIRGLRETYPDARIDVFVPEHYACFVEREGSADRIVFTPDVNRRRPRLAEPDEKKWPYLNTGTKYDVNVDLFCPAFRHEADYGRRRAVWNDRIELFCKAAGAWPESLTPKLPITVQECNAARTFLREHGVSEKKGWIALQPFSTDPARDWPPDKWRQLADALALEGYGVFALDAYPARTRDFPVPQLTRLPLMLLAAVLKVCRLLVAPDSGLAHLMAAVDGRALGLCASQSGAVLYRHYPRHRYIHPPADKAPEFCNWPCYWARQRQCQRQVLKDAGQTCPFLAELEVNEVFNAATDTFKNGNGRTAGALTMPPVGFEAVRSVASDLPDRSRVLDVAGAFASATRLYQARHNLRTEACHGLPIPAFDRTEQVAVCLALPTGDTARAWLWEIFRVLKVGGRFYGPPDLNSIAGDMGFALVSRHTGWSVWQKPGTWPRCFLNC